MIIKTANELRAIRNNPPTREEFEIYQKVRTYYELEDIAFALEAGETRTIDDLTDDELVTVVDCYEDELEGNSSPSELLENVFERAFRN